jgi:hypothetical protein
VLSACGKRLPRKSADPPAHRIACTGQAGEKTGVEETAMTGKFQDLIESTFALREKRRRGQGRRPSEAVARSIGGTEDPHRGDALLARCAVLEIAGQYSDKPEFTIIMRGIRDTAVILVHLELAKKIITSFSGNVYPWYGPNAVCQKAYAEKKVELEDWTILTFPLRLMAGAFGVEAITTQSLIGSSMAERNGTLSPSSTIPSAAATKLGFFRPSIPTSRSSTVLPPTGREHDPHRSIQRKRLGREGQPGRRHRYRGTAGFDRFHPEARAPGKTSGFYGAVRFRRAAGRASRRRVERGSGNV